MSSLFPRKNGKWTIQFFDANRKRRTVRLDTTDEFTANQVSLWIGRIVDFQRAQVPIDAETTKWISQQPADIKDKLEKAGLSDVTEKVSTVGELVTNFMSKFGGESGTKRNNNVAFDNLKQFFGENRLLLSITSGDALEYRNYLCNRGGRKGGPLGQASVAGQLKRAKTLFLFAIRKKWLTDFPFEEVVSGSQSNPDRYFEVLPEVSEEILENFRTFDDKLIFALSRYGGLTLPSEARELKWEWVDWEKERFKVYKPKVKQHSHKRYREVPIFRELRPWLEKAFELADPGAVYVCPALQSSTGQAFTSRLKKVLRRLKIEPWPRILQNLRATRSNEVEREFGGKCESAWIGHSQKVAQENYLVASDSDYVRATSKPDALLRELIKDPERLKAEFLKLKRHERIQLVNDLLGFDDSKALHKALQKALQ